MKIFFSNPSYEGMKDATKDITFFTEIAKAMYDRFDLESFTIEKFYSITGVVFTRADIRTLVDFGYIDKIPRHGSRPYYRVAKNPYTDKAWAAGKRKISLIKALEREITDNNVWDFNTEVKVEEMNRLTIELLNIKE